MPTPRPAKKKSSGIEITRTSTMIVASGPERDREQALRHGRRQLDADLAQGDDEHDGDAEEEHDLAGDSRVPARDRHLHALARARVPAGERRDGEDDAGEQPEAVADAEQAALEEGTATDVAIWKAPSGA